MRGAFVVLVLLLFFVQWPSAHSQGLAPPDPGAQELNRQQERERLLRQQQERTPDIRLELPVPPADSLLFPTDETPCFPVQALVLDGELSAQFQWLLNEADTRADGQHDAVTDHCLGAAGINLVMKRMQHALVRQGYVTTRVLAPPQELSAGTLRLTLVPGRVGQVRFADGTASRATLWNAAPLQAGAVLNIKDIEQALENFKRVPSAEADIQIAVAKDVQARPGESDIVISWKQGLPFRLNLSVDNAGSKATGRYMGALTFSYDHWWTLNDLFYVSLIHDLGGGDTGYRGTRGQTVHYSLPFGYWLLGMTASSNRYWQSVAGANNTLLYSGESSNQEIRLSRLLYRSAVRKTTLSLSGWMRTSGNFIDETEVLVQRRKVAGWEIGIANREYLGSSSLDLNITYKRGTGAMGALPAPEEAFGEGTSRPQILALSTQFITPFSLGDQRLRYAASWRGQWNDTPLVPQDRFAIGSRHTVRGFEGSSLLMAERGWFIRNDLLLALGKSRQELYVGLDHGEVAGPASASLAGRQLSGAAVGLRGSFAPYSYDFFLSRPVRAPDGFDTHSVNAGFSLFASY
jgi:hemolysin activation/secretion protein